MILRRLSEAIRRQDWFVVALEVMIVVVGIFIGLQVDDWNQTRKDMQTEQQYLGDLADDIDAIASGLEARVAFNARLGRVARELDAAILAPVSDERAANIANLVFQSQSRSSMVVDSPTYTDLLSTGRLEIISDRDLRDEIVAFFTRLEWIAVVIEKNHTQTLDQGYSQFLAESGFGYWLSKGPLEDHVYPLDEEFAIRDIYEEAFGEAYMRVEHPELWRPADDPFWPALRRRLTVRLYDVAVDQYFTEGIAERARDLAERIRKGQE